MLPKKKCRIHILDKKLPQTEERREHIDSFPPALQKFLNDSFKSFCFRDEHNKTFFLAYPAAAILNFPDPLFAIHHFCKEEEYIYRQAKDRKTVISRIRIINYLDLLRLIMKSGHPMAKKFQNWFYTDYLPSEFDGDISQIVKELL